VQRCKWVRLNCMFGVSFCFSFLPSLLLYYTTLQKHGVALKKQQSAAMQQANASGISSRVYQGGNSKHNRNVTIPFAGEMVAFEAANQREKRQQQQQHSSSSSNSHLFGISFGNKDSSSSHGSLDSATDSLHATPAADVAASAAAFNSDDYSNKNRDTLGGGGFGLAAGLPPSQQQIEAHMADGRRQLLER
jgi:hypothetical protein